MSKEFHALVFVGRFQIFHDGHKAVIDRALELADQVIVVVGSSFRSRNTKNPFTFHEREQMIRSVFPDPRVVIVPVRDYPNSDGKWINAIQSVVMASVNYTPDPLKIGLIGHSKDSSSYYLKIFPTWKTVEVPNVDNINATDIRNGYLYDGAHSEELSKCPHEVQKYLVNFYHSKVFDELQDEFEMILKYKLSWVSAPFPPVFVTTDAVVIQSGHVLLGKRKFAPGKGLWCVPGGFINQDELIEDCAIRELLEETNIDLPIRTLKRLITSTKVFDRPDRGSRGRTITHAFLFDLGYDTKLPKIRADDDIEEVRWVPYAEVNSELMFEDHHGILSYFLNLE